MSVCRNVYVCMCVCLLCRRSTFLCVAILRATTQKLCWHLPATLCWLARSFASNLLRPTTRAMHAVACVRARVVCACVCCAFAAQCIDAVWHVVHVLFLCCSCRCVASASCPAAINFGVHTHTVRVRALDGGASVSNSWQTSDIICLCARARACALSLWRTCASLEY